MKRLKKEFGYLYLHIRDDTGEVFYVGIGTDKRNFKRAKDRDGRNKFWKRIVAKTSYTIEIVFKEMPLEWIIIKEMEFIALYGRRKFNQGNLVNIEPGGSIGNKWSEKKKEDAAERCKTRKPRVLTPEGKERMLAGNAKGRANITPESRARAGLKQRGIPKPNSGGRKPVTQFTLDGEFVRNWSCAKQAKSEGFTSGHISSCCSGTRKTHAGFIWKYTKDI